MYKVLVDGESPNMSDPSGQKWSLPCPTAEGVIPGARRRIRGELSPTNGILLVDDPVKRLEVSCRVYRAEAFGPGLDLGNGLAVYQEARLTAEADDLIPAWWRLTEDFIRDLADMPWGAATALGPGMTAGRGDHVQAEREHKRIVELTFSITNRLAYAMRQAMSGITNAMRSVWPEGYERYANTAHDHAHAYWLSNVIASNWFEQRDRDFVLRARARWEAWQVGHYVLGGEPGALIVADPGESLTPGRPALRVSAPRQGRLLGLTAT